jgi:PIN domain nuclease of toxin-antitoxin system
MILLDTPILVWLLIAPENLSPKAKKAAFGRLHGWQ